MGVPKSQASFTTHPNQFVFGSGGKVAAIRAEADAADVQVGSHILRIVILEHADLLACLDVEDLRRSIAARCNILTIVAESDAAHDAFVGEGVDQVHVQDALNLGIKDGVPVGARLLVVRRNSVNFEVAERIADGRCAGATHARMVRRRVANLRGLSASRVGDRGVDLRRRGPNGVWWSADTSPTRPWGRRALGGLRSHAVGDGTLRIALLVGGLLGIRMWWWDRKARWAFRPAYVAGCPVRMLPSVRWKRM